MCIFCGIAERTEKEAVVWENSTVSVIVTLHQKARNRGAIMVIPKEHYSDLYELPVQTLCEVARVSKLCANAMKASLGCDGITILQNNESAGGQDVFHYHLHVIPRYQSDQYFESVASVCSLQDRRALGETIRGGMDL